MLVWGQACSLREMMTIKTSNMAKGIWSISIVLQFKSNSFPLTQVQMEDYSTIRHSHVCHHPSASSSSASGKHLNTSVTKHTKLTMPPSLEEKGATWETSLSKGTGKCEKAEWGPRGSSLVGEREPWRRAGEECPHHQVTEDTVGLAEEPGQSRMQPGLGRMLEELALPFFLILNISSQIILSIF